MHWRLTGTEILFFLSFTIKGKLGNSLTVVITPTGGNLSLIQVGDLYLKVILWVQQVWLIYFLYFKKSKSFYCVVCNHKYIVTHIFIRIFWAFFVFSESKNLMFFRLSSVFWINLAASWNGRQATSSWRKACSAAQCWARWSCGLCIVQNRLPARKRVSKKHGI